MHRIELGKIEIILLLAIAIIFYLDYWFHCRSGRCYAQHTAPFSWHMPSALRRFPQRQGTFFSNTNTYHSPCAQQRPLSSALLLRLHENPTKSPALPFSLQSHGQLSTQSVQASVTFPLRFLIESFTSLVFLFLFIIINSRLPLLTYRFRLVQQIFSLAVLLVFLIDLVSRILFLTFSQQTVACVVTDIAPFIGMVQRNNKAGECSPSIHRAAPEVWLKPQITYGDKLWELWIENMHLHPEPC